VLFRSTLPTARRRASVHADRGLGNAAVDALATAEILADIALADARGRRTGHHFADRQAVSGAVGRAAAGPAGVGMSHHALHALQAAERAQFAALCTAGSRRIDIGDDGSVSGRIRAGTAVAAGQG